MAPKNRLAAKAEAILNDVQKLQDNNDMTVATAKRIEELETEQGKLQRKKKSLDASYEKSTDDYSRIWNRGFAADFLQVLAARELRDQVYRHLIGGSPFAIILSRHQSLPKKRWNRYWFHLQPVDRRGRSQRRSHNDELAHYFTERYMGEEFAIEIAQVFHRHAIYELHAVSAIFTLLEDGPLTVHPSCQPQHYIRNLKVTVFMDSLLRESDGQLARYSETEDESEKQDYDNQLAWLSHVKTLHQVSQLQLMLELQAVYSSTIRRYKAVLFPHIRELVKAGCVVTVSQMTPQTYPHVRDMIIYTSTMLPFISEQESLVADAFKDED